MTLSVVIISFNEEANIGRALQSVAPLLRDLGGEAIVVDSGSTDRTCEIARSLGAKVYPEMWKGFGAQKNSAISKATGEWILSLDADEALEPALADEIRRLLGPSGTGPRAAGYFLPRKNYIFGRWIRHGGFYPDRKLRLFRKGSGDFGERPVHESLRVNGVTGSLAHALIHHNYPTLTGYIDTMNRYSSLAAEGLASASGGAPGLGDIVLRPLLQFAYRYFFRLGFLDGREGLLLHLYHSVYVSWKYAKAWERTRALRRQER